MEKPESGKKIRNERTAGIDAAAGGDIFSEAFRRALIENLPQAVFLKDTDSVYVYCNKQFAADLGIEPGDIKGRSDYDFFPEHLARFYRSIDKKVIESGEVREVEEKYIRNGNEITIHTVKAPAKDASGRTTGILGIFWDITEQKDLQEQIRRSKDELELKVLERTKELKNTAEDLRKSEEKFKTLFENIGDIVLIHGLDGGILDANATAAEILGYSKEGLKRQNLQDIESPEFSDSFRERTAAARRGKTAVYQSAYLTSEGKSIPVEVNSRIFEYGGVRCLLSVCRDITDRLSAEEALLESAQKLRSSLDKSVEALASASEKRDPYTSGHHQRVCQLSLAIAEAMHLPDETLRALGLAAEIHDIGKLYVPAEILGKPRPLSESEFKIVRLHTSAGYDITKKIDFPQEVARAILQHHERFDGSGYPLGLKGGDISTSGKILAVADVFEAMTSHRPYRPAHSMETAVEEISANKNRLYDPEISDVCVELIKSCRFTFKAPY